jgi:hypothetical protein
MTAASAPWPLLCPLPGAEATKIIQYTTQQFYVVTKTRECYCFFYIFVFKEEVHHITPHHPY